MAGLRLVIGICLAATVAGAQQPTFRSGTRVVPIYATVRGAAGRFLVDLQQDDFEVLDNGKPQVLTAFSNQPEPIVAVAMWDVSTSLTRYSDWSRGTARAFVRALWPGDRLRFGSFGEEIAFSPHLTGDKRTLERVIDEELWFGGGTRLWAALDRALGLLMPEAGRRAVVTLTDGNSSADTRSRDDVLMTVHRADTMVYALGLEGAGLSGALRSVADESGGGYAVIKANQDLDRQLEAVMVELHHQYLLGFVTDAADRRIHTLTVRTRITGATVRARRGYVADPSGR
jgi:VWFA-related protein